jgi:endonuclease-3
LIYPVGFYKTKAKNLKKMAEMLKKDFSGKVPYDIDELVKLPGVGRKTANLVVSVAFSQDSICVDTHVHKILNRIGYIKTKNPLETEMVLREKLPKKMWSQTNRIFVPFGQKLCRPVSPKCDICPIYKYCKRINVKKLSSLSVRI